MKSIRSLAALMFFAVLFAVPVFAQTGATTPSGAKVAVVDTSAFADEKAGITRFVAALKQLDAEFKPRRDELQGLTNRLTTLGKDYEALVKQASTPNSPVSPQTVDAKREEAETLQKDIKRKQEDAQAAFARSQERVLGPIYQDIGKAIGDYAKQKGYAMIFDLSKDQNQMIVYTEIAQTDITPDFVKFYNARPAGTATAAPRTAAPAPR